ncbi:hypothetical protein RDI58_010456 [Solanum bulbocastanum]|uniref:Endonuclease/exonuclease/phosphatase domain-containing protein n=1 Tax=Solanum bulbocastanum TaxID=147425 RepID=A0AAN8TPC3_SOLBU
MFQIKKISLFGLIETRVKQHKANKILTNITPTWGHLENYCSATNGRIWICWDTSMYTILKINEHNQLLHCQVKNNSNVLDCLLTIIYGLNTQELRKTLWISLKNISQGINSPWIIGGDFNAQLYPQDRKYGNIVQHAEIKDFAGCMNELLLSKVN